jgi:hypothetical protein
MSAVEHNGWLIEFSDNIYMYYHSLKVSKGDHNYDIPCEDTPENFIGIWLYQLNLDDSIVRDLLVGLREWITSQSGINYRIYKSENDYETNRFGHSTTFNGYAQSF